jgi:Putative zinc- or iron-chelating domain
VNLATFAAALNEIGGQLPTCPAILPEEPPPARSVDCGQCRACCHMAVFIGPWDDPAAYRLQPGTTILERRADGACVYLDDETGCTIYPTRPTACRAFACAEFVRTADPVQAEALAADHPQFRRVLDEGHKRGQ